MNGSEPATEAELTLLITEFQALHAEILDSLGTARTLVGLFLVSLGALASVAVSGRVTPQVLVILPLLSAVFWCLHLDTRMVVAEIALYVATCLAPQARALGSERSLGWESWLRCPPGGGARPSSSFWAYKLSTGLDGSAWPVYLLPSLLALVLTIEGATAPLFLFRANSGHIFYYPVWLWWLGALLQGLLILRAYGIESDWWTADVAEAAKAAGKLSAGRAPRNAAAAPPRRSGAGD